MQLPSQLWQQEAVAALKQRPAVLFVHMARDERTAGSVHRGVAQLQAQARCPATSTGIWHHRCIHKIRLSRRSRYLLAAGSGALSEAAQTVCSA